MFVTVLVTRLLHRGTFGKGDERDRNDASASRAVVFGKASAWALPDGTLHQRVWFLEAAGGQGEEVSEEIPINTPM